MNEYIVKIKLLIDEIQTELLDAWKCEAIAGTFDNEWYDDKKEKKEIVKELQDIVTTYDY